MHKKTSENRISNLEVKAEAARTDINVLCVRVTDGVKTSNENEGQMVKLIERLDSRVEVLEGCVDSQHKSRLAIEDMFNKMDVEHDDHREQLEFLDCKVAKLEKKADSPWFGVDWGKDPGRAVTATEILEESNRERLAKIRTLEGEKKTLRTMNDNQRQSITTLQVEVKELKEKKSPERWDNATTVEVKGEEATRFLEEVIAERGAKMEEQDRIINAQAETIAKKGRSNATLSETNDELTRENSQLWATNESIVERSDRIEEGWNDRCSTNLNQAHMIGELRKGEEASRQAISELQTKVQTLSEGNAGYMERNGNQKDIIHQLGEYKDELSKRNGILRDFIVKIRNQTPAMSPGRGLVEEAIAQINAWDEADK